MDLHLPQMKIENNSTKRTFSDSAKEAFTNSLLNTDWTFVEDQISTQNINIVYTSFITKYKSLYDLAFPLVKVTQKRRDGPRQPWMTMALLKSCKKKAKLYKKFLKNPTPQNKLKFTQHRNKFKQIKELSESSYYAESFTQCKNDLNKTWKIIKKILHSNGDSELRHTFIIAESETKDPLLSANSFNDYFVNIGPSLANEIPSTPVTIDSFMPFPLSCSFGSLPTSEMEIINVTALLKTTTSAGSDDINPAIAQSSIGLAFIAAPLASIINSSFYTGLEPDDLKIARVVPIFKAGQKNSISNYRPISILPFFSKILEKLMATRLSDYIERHAILTDAQYGFRHDLPTYMALIDMQMNVSESMNQSKFSLGVFFYISKAFDTVNHDLLIRKLEILGIRGIVKAWFIDYLKNRIQYVYYKGSASPHKIISCGVPQGSILGPLLFLIYINDLAVTSTLLKFIMFADDTNVFLSLLFEIMNY